MPRYDDMPDRDQRGRFVSDDDRGGYYGSRASDRERDSRGRFMSDDDDGGRNRSSRGSSRHDDASDRDRDSRGRFVSDDDSRSRASSRYDDDRRYGRSRDDDDRDHGQGGWFGDSRGHAEAARRGWENRRGDDDRDSYGTSYGRGFGRQDEDRRHARSGDDDYSRDRGQGGWSGEYDSRSGSSRRDWENRRR